MSKPASNRLLVMGCGATAWDVAGRVQGAADLPLTLEGRSAIPAAIAAAGGELAYVRTILAGPDEASRDTAFMLADAVWTEAAARAKVIVVPQLAELGLGLWEGRALKDLVERCPRAASHWLADPASVTAPDGETWDEFDARVLSGMARGLAKAKAGAPLAIVLRPIVLDFIRSRLTGTPLGTGTDLLRAPTEPLWIDLVKDDPRLRVRSGEPAVVRAA